jgi:ATP-dependent DNA helicase RecG
MWCCTPTKAARGGTPKNLYEYLSAFANTRGGVLLLGLNEAAGFEIVGVKDAQQLQADVAANAAQLHPQPALRISHFAYEGREIVVADVDELSPSQRPSHLKAKDEASAWVRVGNTTHDRLPGVRVSQCAFTAGL